MTRREVIVRTGACCLLGGLGLIALGTGCASTVMVTKTATSKKGGIPYYLPKPYLVLTKNILPAQPKKTSTRKITKDGAKETTTISEGSESVFPKIDEKGTYTMQILFLPDFTERHELNIEARSGSLEAVVALKDGWQLTGVTIKSDSKTAETIGAAASLVEAVSPAFTPVVGAPEKNVYDLLIALAPSLKAGDVQPLLGPLTKALAEEPKRRIWVYEFVQQDGTASLRFVDVPRFP